MTSLKIHAVNLADVIVVKGCSASDVEPCRRWLNDCEVTVIESQGNHYDFNGLCALYKYLYHSLIVGTGYILIHDTCEATATLPSAMKRLDFSDPNIVYVPPPPAANICAVGRGVLVRMSDASAFRAVVSKRQAMDVEHGRSRESPPVHTYGRRVSIRSRRRCGVDKMADEMRLTFFYPDFGIYKFVTMQPFKGKSRVNVTGHDTPQDAVPSI